MAINRWNPVHQLVQLTDHLMRTVGSLEVDDERPNERFSCVAEAMAVPVPARASRSSYPHWPSRH